MTLYLDSSAFAKIYIEEPESPQVINEVRSGGANVVTHEIAHIEIRAALASAMRRRVITTEAWDAVRHKFLSDWKILDVVRVSPSLIGRAAELAEGFALRSYDSLHLATVEYLHKQTKGDVDFGCFDKRLSEAARLLGIPLRF